jgi:hypothetical protein
MEEEEEKAISNMLITVYKQSYEPNSPSSYEAAGMFSAKANSIGLYLIYYRHVIFLFNVWHLSL